MLTRRLILERRVRFCMRKRTTILLFRMYHISSFFLRRVSPFKSTLQNAVASFVTGMKYLLALRHGERHSVTLRNTIFRTFPHARIFKFPRSSLRSKLFRLAFLRNTYISCRRTFNKIIFFLNYTFYFFQLC